MKIFITDGSPAAFFSAVFDAFNLQNCKITSDKNLQLYLGNELVNIVYDYGKCNRVRKGIEKYDKFAEDEILLVLRSCDSQKEQIAFNYIKKIIQKKSPVGKMMNLPEVIAFNDILYKVTGETHRMKGFLRFTESSNGTLYAPYSPDNDITDLLVKHFSERLKSEKFLIHDIKRKIAGLYNGSECIMGNLDDAEIVLSDNEKAIENLWKKYYKSVNIKERPHEKQMKGYMPVRYWKFLPEKHI